MFYFSLDGVVKWMQHLPSHLVQGGYHDNRTTSSLLLTMRQLAAQGQQAFIEALQKHSIQMIGKCDGFVFL